MLFMKLCRFHCYNRIDNKNLKSLRAIQKYYIEIKDKEKSACLTC